MEKKQTDHKLNLPPFEPQLKSEGGESFIFDPIRRKYVKLEPEEWVRQHFVHLLLDKGYPRGLFAVERGHKQNKRQKRTDILVHDRSGNALMLVECKAPKVPINKTVLQQALFYNQTHCAPFLGISNGLVHFFFFLDKKTGKTEQLSTLPNFEEALQMATRIS